MKCIYNAVVHVIWIKTSSTLFIRIYTLHVHVRRAFPRLFVDSERLGELSITQDQIVSSSKTSLRLLNFLCDHRITSTQFVDLMQCFRFIIQRHDIALNNEGEALWAVGLFQNRALFLTTAWCFSSFPALES